MGRKTKVVSLRLPSFDYNCAMTLRMASSPLVWLLAVFNLLLAALQLLFFVPMVVGGRSLDLVFFRVDALNFAFGVVWALALGLGLPALMARTGLSSIRLTALLSLFSVGLLGLAYAREPLVFLVGWEIAGLALWLSLREMRWPGSLRRAALSVHLPGLLLLAAVLLGPVGPFVPPPGGGATPWPLFVAILFGLVVLFRAGCWLFLEPPIVSKPVSPLIPLYILIAPFLLAKALVAAPWEGLGAWLLALMGTALLLGALLVLLFGASHINVAVTALAAVGIAGFGLAPLSPLAAAGAVALLLAGALWAMVPTWSYRGALLLTGGLLGVWLLSQGALDARYRLVAALLLPAMLFVAYYARSESDASPSKGLVGFVVLVLACPLILAAIYPQAAVEWVLRPAIGAMAGGVGVPSTLITNWGLGLLVRSAQEAVLAALPATGIALAAFLAWTVLYWLRGLARFVDERRKTKDERGIAPESGDLR
jgi:hypothetical protein